MDCTGMALAVEEAIDMDVGEKRVLAQFKSEDGALIGTPFDLPIDVTHDSLALLCNAVLKNVRPCARVHVYLYVRTFMLLSKMHEGTVQKINPRVFIASALMHSSVP